VVERLKDAISKARELRETGVSRAPMPAPAAQDRPDELRDAMVTAVAKGPAQPPNRQRARVDDEWTSLQEMKLNPSRLDLHRIVAYSKTNPAHLAFDMLRTRILNVLRTNGWTRLAITSPTKSCGKTMVATNLAMSLGHQNDLRSMLFDVDLRMPKIASYLDAHDRFNVADFLQGRTDPKDYLRRVGTNLAVGLNTSPNDRPAELFHHERTAEVLSTMIARYRPNVVIYDLPPMLVSDDVMAFLPHVDCVLMVTAAGTTKPKEITDAEQLLGEQTNFLGVMLNKSKEKFTHSYYYRGSD
jgi:protein-tyrosine kinase